MLRFSRDESPDSSRGRRRQSSNGNRSKFSGPESRESADGHASKGSSLDSIKLIEVDKWEKQRLRGEEPAPRSPEEEREYLERQGRTRRRLEEKRRSSHRHVSKTSIEFGMRRDGSGAAESEKDDKREDKVAWERQQRLEKEEVKAQKEKELRDKKEKELKDQKEKERYELWQPRRIFEQRERGEQQSLNEENRINEEKLKQDARQRRAFEEEARRKQRMYEAERSQEEARRKEFQRQERRKERMVRPINLPRFQDSTKQQRTPLPDERSLFNSQGFLIPKARAKTIHEVQQHVEGQDVTELQRILSSVTKNGAPASKIHYEHLEELRSRCKSDAAVAELLVDDALGSPWTISTTSATNSHHHGLPDDSHHFQGCVHELAGVVLPSGLAKQTTDTNPHALEMPDVSQALGLAGLLENLDIGFAEFESEDRGTVKIFYEFDRAHDLLTVLESICGAAARLQKLKVCCESFTVLCLARSAGIAPAETLPSPNYVELCRVDFALLLDLLHTLQDALVHSDRHYDHAIGSLSRAASAILAVPTGTDAVTICAPFFHDERVAFHLASLATQFMAVGLQSYSQAHTGLLHPSCLLEPLNNITLCGLRKSNLPSDFKLHFQLQHLACLKGMMPQGVMVVIDNKRAEVLRDAGRSPAFQMMTSAIDFVDTWDSSKLIFANSGKLQENVVSIRAGRGAITLTGRQASQQSINAQAAHWSKIDTVHHWKNPRFAPSAMLMIGAVSINPACTLDETSLFIDAESRSLLDKLCTSNETWENTMRTVGLTAGQYVTANFNKAYTKVPGVTLKQAYMEAFETDLILKPILESTWGMQLSLCTGVARRVPMHVMVADVIEAFAESSLHEPDWKRMTRRHDVVARLRANEIKELLTDLRHRAKYRETLESIIKGILNTMKRTGIDSGSGTLTVAWATEDDPLACMKFRCNDMSLWTKMLADSPDVATFAYMTRLCLETDTRSCTRAHRDTWQVRPYMLQTAVNVDNPLDREGPRHRLRDGREYWIGKESLHLRAETVFRERDDPFIFVTQSKLWGSMQRRLAHLDRARGQYLCLQERRRMVVPAKEVIVLTTVPTVQRSRSSSRSSLQSTVSKGSSEWGERNAVVPARRIGSRPRRPQESNYHDLCACTLM